MQPAVSGGLAGAVVGAVASVAVAFVPQLMNSNSFDQNIVLEAVKASKTAADLEGALKELCKRKFIKKSEHCPT
jgi:hypothetical protein